MFSGLNYFVKLQTRVDEFVMVLLGALIFIIILTVVWTTPPEALPMVSPRSIEISVIRGGTRVVTLTINGSATNVSLSAEGEIKDWVRFSKQNFNVFNFGSVSISFYVPEDTEEGVYTGNIVLKSLGGEIKIPVSLKVVYSAGENLAFRQLEPFESFKLESKPSTVVLEERKNMKIERGYFSNRYVGFGKKIEDSYESLTLEFEIEDTNLLGNLVIEVNGVKVFDKKASPGIYLVKLPTNVTILNLNIYAANPGWLFWEKTHYKIKWLKVVGKMEVPTSKEFAFDLTPEEIENFAFFKLSMLIKNSTFPIPKFSILINNQIVYKSSPPTKIFYLCISRDILGNPLYLKVRNNSIKFVLEEQGFIEILSPQLFVYRLA